MYHKKPDKPDKSLAKWVEEKTVRLHQKEAVFGTNRNIARQRTTSKKLKSSKMNQN